MYSLSQNLLMTFLACFMFGWGVSTVVLVLAMNGLSVAGMAIGATIALLELLRRGYDKRMVTGVIQAGSSLGIFVPPSVVLVLYAMIVRQPIGQLWLAGIAPGLLMGAMFVAYIAVRQSLLLRRPRVV
jgi:TRAP-type C4-dicarboxylate transport system permease large subunit